MTAITSAVRRADLGALASALVASPARRFGAAVLVVGLMAEPAYPGRPMQPGPSLATPGIGQIELTWAPPTEGPRVRRQRVYRDGQLVAVLPPAARTWLDSSLGAGASHSYEIAAVGERGEGPRTPAVFATTAALPGPPEQVGAETGEVDGAVRIRWSRPASDGGAPIEGYVVRRDGAVIRELERFSTDFLDTGRSLGAQHTYEVAARNALGTGPMAAAPIVTIKPGVQQLFVSSRRSAGSRTGQPLAAGVPYVIEVSGVYTYGRGQADAECSTGPDDQVFRPNRWQALDPRGDALDVMISGTVVRWEPVQADRNGCSIDHVYRYRLTPAKAGLLQLAIRDPYAVDNQGSLVVRVLPAG